MKFDIGDYYLDLELIFTLDKFKIDKVFGLYHQINDSGASFGLAKITDSYFKTLLKAGYLKNYTQEIRDEKIEQING